MEKEDNKLMGKYDTSKGIPCSDPYAKKMETYVVILVTNNTHYMLYSDVGNCLIEIKFLNNETDYGTTLSKTIKEISALPFVPVKTHEGAKLFDYIAPSSIEKIYFQEIGKKIRID